MTIIVGAASWCCLLLALSCLSFAKAAKHPRYDVVRVLRGTAPIEGASIAASGGGDGSGSGGKDPRMKREEKVPPPPDLSLRSSGISHEAVDKIVTDDAGDEGGSMMIVGEYGKMSKGQSVHKKCKKSKSMKASQNESTEPASETPLLPVPKGKSMKDKAETHSSSESIAASGDGSGGDKDPPPDLPSGSGGISHEAVDRFITNDAEGEGGSMMIMGEYGKMGKGGSMMSMSKSGKMGKGSSMMSMGKSGHVGGGGLEGSTRLMKIREK